MGLQQMGLQQMGLGSECSQLRSPTSAGRCRASGPHRPGITDRASLAIGSLSPIRTASARPSGHTWGRRRLLGPAPTIRARA
jgi:hypothetical protein